MASAPSLSRLRSISRSVVVVRCATSLRKYRRIRCAHVLLFLALAHSGERGVAYGTGDRCRLGCLWDNLYCDRGRTYSLCSARSCPVELAAHRAAGHIARHRDRLAVFAHRCGSDGAGLSSLRRPRAGGKRASSSGLRRAWWPLSCYSPCTSFIPMSLRRAYGAQSSGERLGADLPCSASTRRSQRRSGVRLLRPLCGFQSHWSLTQRGRERATSAILLLC